MKYLLIVLMALTLVACAKRWTHPEYSQERFQADNAACEQHALKLSQEGSRRREREIMNSCLEGKGWSKSVGMR